MFLSHSSKIAGRRSDEICILQKPHPKCSEISFFTRHTVNGVLNIENVMIFVREKVCVGLIESLRY